MSPRFLSAHLAVVLTCGGAAGLHAQLPKSVRLIWQTAQIDDAPLSTRSSIRVSEQGVVAYRGVAGTDYTVLVVERSGRVAARFGRPGTGPAELRDPEVVSVASSAVTVWDPATRRLSRWDLKGKLGSERVLSGTARPVLLTPNGLFGSAYNAPDRSWQPMVLAGTSDGWLPALARGEAGATAVASNPSGVTAAPVLGIWAGGYVVVDPNVYEVRFFDQQGTRVATTRIGGRGERPTSKRVEAFLDEVERSQAMSGAQRDQLKSQAAQMTLPLVGPGTPQFDGRGRMWVTGFLGDAAFADVFQGHQRLGRLEVDCPGFEGMFSVAGSYLAMLCRGENETFDGDAVVRLFVIE